LDQGGFGHIGFVHRGDHRLDPPRPVTRPVGLMPANRRTRVAQRVAGNHMRMYVDDRHGHSLSNPARVANFYWCAQNARYDVERKLLFVSTWNAAQAEFSPPMSAASSGPRH